VNRREGHAAAVRFLDAVGSSPRVRVVQVAESLEATALTWLRSHDEREYSFVDATSFAVMRATGIDRALAYDGDFTAAGSMELR
jgi:predicted nucleic acid-binding protein